MLEEQTRFVIFSAGGNSQEWVKQHVLSVKKQSYSNYIHVIVDDATTDKTYSRLKELEHERMSLLRNSNNVKWICNAVTYLDGYIQDENDVIVLLDLDDWLANQNVLKKLNEIYTKEQCWLTYGSMVQAEGTSSIDRVNISYPKDVIAKKTYRTSNTWSWLHLRTFKAFLWQNLDKNHLKMPDGSWPPYTYDKFIGFPLLEMCKTEKIRQINDILYVYNRNNPKATRLQKRNSKLGKGLGAEARMSPIYKTLERD